MHSILPTILMISVQLLAVVLLQVPLFLPLLGKAMFSSAHGSVCYHDHRLCGCSPDRIASHTCCCAREEERFRMAADLNEEESASPCCRHGQHSKARHVLMMAPCGMASPLFVSSVQDHLFTRYAGEMSLIVPRNIRSFEYPGSLLKGYFDPPKPPPRILYSV
ncbi:MAG: hypothetical protein WCA04_00535 [Geobacteraceae bacterium]